jgi:hypothetical protein
MIIAYQGPQYTIGDFFLTTHAMYSHHVRGDKVVVMISPKTKENILDLYKRCNFLKLVEVEDDSTEYFLKLCSLEGYDGATFMSTNMLKGVRFQPLYKWFNNDEKPTIPPGCIGIHITSSTNYDRPTIPFFQSYLNVCKNYPVCFFGLKSDEDLFIKNYPGIKETVPEELWRFGKDSLLQTLANLGTLRGMICFSSWTAYGSTLQWVPTLELWGDKQWMSFSNIVRTMLGSPIHYSQDSYYAQPLPCLTEVFQYLTNYRIGG